MTREEKYETIGGMRESGMTWRQIGEQFGTDGETMRHRYKRMRKRFGKDIQAHLDENNIDPSTVHGAWSKSESVSVYTKYDNKLTPEDFVASFTEMMGIDVPKVKIDTSKFDQRGHLLMIDPCDLHIGKLSTQRDDKYDIEIAISLAKEGIAGILKRAEGHNISQILLIIGNDVLHVDTPRRTTTSGTPQDTDGMWYDAYTGASLLYRETIEQLSEVAPVHVIYNPSNHDWMTGFCLAHSIQCAFIGNPRVTFDVDIAHRKYIKFGVNLIGTSHGDGAKMDNMPLLMANEEPELWSKTSKRYWFLHHIHHMKKVNWKSGEDYVGATVQYLRSPSAADRWHKDNGFCGGKRAIEGFVFDPEEGQCAMFTHNF